MEKSVYIVVCKDEGEYCLASKRFFDTKEESEKYARTVASTREAHCVRLDGLHAAMFRALKKQAEKYLRDKK